jgi:hypothetical protein
VAPTDSPRPRAGCVATTTHHPRGHTRDTHGAVDDWEGAAASLPSCRAWRRACVHDPATSTTVCAMDTPATHMALWMIGKGRLLLSPGTVHGIVHGSTIPRPSAHMPPQPPCARPCNEHHHHIPKLVATTLCLPIATLLFDCNHAGSRHGQRVAGLPEDGSVVAKPALEANTHTPYPAFLWRLLAGANLTATGTARRPLLCPCTCGSLQCY